MKTDVYWMQGCEYQVAGSIQEILKKIEGFGRREGDENYIIIL